MPAKPTQDLLCRLCKEILYLNIIQLPFSTIMRFVNFYSYHYHDITCTYPRYNNSIIVHTIEWRNILIFLVMPAVLIPRTFLGLPLFFLDYSWFSRRKPILPRQPTQDLLIVQRKFGFLN